MISSSDGSLLKLSAVLARWKKGRNGVCVRLVVAVSVEVKKRGRLKSKVFLPFLLVVVLKKKKQKVATEQ